MATMQELKAQAEQLLAMAEAAETIADKKRFEEELEQKINEHNAESKAICYTHCKESGDAMKTAITEFFYPAIKVKETVDKDTKAVMRNIIDCVKPIDLGDLHKKLDGIGADKLWFNYAEKLNFYLTVKAANELGATVNCDAFRMQDISKQIDMGKNPLSNTSILKTLQTVITAMLGDGFNATSHDVKYLMYVYAQDNRKSKTSITAANHKTLRGYLKKVCYRILTNGTGYEVEQREIKE